MNNRDFILELSKRLGYDVKETGSLMAALNTCISEQLEEDRVVMIQGFGSFEVKKKLERVVVNPATQQKMLVPPKLVVGFRPSTLLKEVYNKDESGNV